MRNDHWIKIDIQIYWQVCYLHRNYDTELSTVPLGKWKVKLLSSARKFWTFAKILLNKKTEGEINTEEH